jgi:hypothetical protein
MNVICNRLPLSLIPLSLFICCSTGEAASVRTVALTGQHAPGTPDGVYFRYLLPTNTLVLNDAGHMAFSALLAGSGIVTGDSGNDRGIWSEGSGSLALVARSGEPAPGMPPGANFMGGSTGAALGINLTDLNNLGQTAFNTYAANGGAGIWSDRSGSLALVARAYVSWNTPQLNDAGQIAFLGRVDYSESGDGAWLSDASGSLAPVALAGDHAPGMPDDANFLPYFFTGRDTITLNNAGRTAFAAASYGTVSGFAGGIWSDRSGNLALVVRDGDQAPGLPAGVQFANTSSSGGREWASHIALNDTGQIAFATYIQGPGVDYTNNESIWSERTGSLALVAREGSQAPGMSDGTNFGDLAGLVQNNAGQIAFTDEFRRGVWSDVSGSLQLVASGQIDRGSIALNDDGQIALSGTINGQSGIWATDRTGTLQRVFGRGDLLEVAPGDFRTIGASGSYRFLGGNLQGRRSTGLNNLGQVAFWVRFNDGSHGIFVSNAVAVPEPSNFALAALGFLHLLARRADRADRIA